MLKFKYGGGLGNNTVMGIGVTHDELLSLLAGKRITVTGCPVSEIPDMILVAGVSDDAIQESIEKSLVTSSLAD